MSDEVPRASELPKLDAFDQEFGRGLPAATSQERRRTTLRMLAGVVVAAAIISVPALAWFYADDLPLRPGSMSQPGGQRTDAAAEIDRLTREVAVLKHEIRMLTDAQQQSAELIESLKAAEEEARNPPTYWWSELAKVNFGGEPPAASGPPSAATARGAAPAREAPRPRDPGTPLSLEPPQQ
jgi:hypothetical protein